jgi:TRAP-type mannitol/chloroaromatic compound transport system permease small subunit
LFNKESIKKFFITKDNIITKVGNWGLLVSGVMMLIMSVLATYGVARRYLFDNPEPYSYELGIMLLVGCVVFSVAGLQRSERHLRVDFLANLFPLKAQVIFAGIVTPLLALLYVGVVTWKSLEGVIYSISIWETSQSAWEEPLWPTKILVPICLFWVCLVLISQLVHGIISLIKGNYVKPYQVEADTTPKPEKGE